MRRIACYLYQEGRDCTLPSSVAALEDHHPRRIALLRKCPGLAPAEAELRTLKEASDRGAGGGL